MYDQQTENENKPCFNAILTRLIFLDEAIVYSVIYSVGFGSILFLVVLCGLGEGYNRLKARYHFDVDVDLDSCNTTFGPDFVDIWCSLN